MAVTGLGVLWIAFITLAQAGFSMTSRCGLDVPPQDCDRYRTVASVAFFGSCVIGVAVVVLAFRPHPRWPTKAVVAVAGAIAVTAAYFVVQSLYESVRLHL